MISCFTAKHRLLVSSSLAKAAMWEISEDNMFLFPLHSENMLFGMGNPLLDISAVVDKDFLDK